MQNMGSVGPDGVGVGLDGSSEQPQVMGSRALPLGQRDSMQNTGSLGGGVGLDGSSGQPQVMGLRGSPLGQRD